MITLGISLGTTTTGIAVLNGNELADWQIHSFREKWSDKKPETVINRIQYYFSFYRIQVVVVKLPPASHQTSSVMLLLSKLKELCTYHGCMVKACTKQDLKDCIPDARNNRDIMRFAIEHYPIITPQYTQALSRKNQYHKKLFEAIVAAHHWQSINK